MESGGLRETLQGPDVLDSRCKPFNNAIYNVAFE